MRPSPAVVSESLNKYHQRYNTNIEDTWFEITQEWDLNIYLSSNEVLCATLYPVENGCPVTERPFPMIVDPSIKLITWVELPV